MPRRFTSAGVALLLALLGAALVFLAVLQYRWIGEVSAAEEQRSAAALDLAARQFTGELERHIGRIVNAFQGMGDAEQLPQRAHEWATTDEPALVRAIYLADGTALQRFDPQTQQLVDVAWPAELAPLRERLSQQQRRPPLFDEIPAVVMPIPRRPPPPAGPRPAPPPPRSDDQDFDDRGGQAPPPVSGGDRRWFPSGQARRPSPTEQADDRPRPPRRPIFVIAQIDREVLANTLIGGLAKRFFAADDDVAVLDPQGTIAWRSSSRWSGENADVDRTILTLGPRPPSGEMSRWHLRARRSGALAASIAQARRRNLGVSFAVLLVLAVTTVLLAMLLRRAESLRRQQMEFVAGVTHELNTPLAALTSAGQNLADGIIAAPEQVARYGSMIVKESRRLSNMVAQVLDFAGLVAARAPRTRERVAVAELVEEGCRFVEGVQLDVDVPANLPQVEGDADALARAVQNLVTNAIKYGDGKWVGVRAAAEKNGVAITVDDRGPGIAPHDLPHLFDPFFRGAATAERVRGNGLGLTLVRQIAVHHGGRVTVERRRGGGSSFTIHLPVANA